MTSPSFTSPRMIIRAKAGYWPIWVGTSVFHTPHGSLPTRSLKVPGISADWNS